ncbi:MAG: carboxypeptidase-like regulatory domain-containing protein [Halorientalis sp.]
MGFDTRTDGTIVALSLLAVVGLLVVGATPAAAQSNATADDGPPEFDFDIDDGANFGFGGDDSTGFTPDFDFGNISTGSPFDFSGIGGDVETPDFGGIGDVGNAPDFSGIGDVGNAPDFGGIGNGDGASDDGGDGQNGGDGASPADFQVSNLNAPAEATVGDTITVSATVENVGGQQATQSVAFGIDTDGDGQLEEITAKDTTLAAGASTTVTFEVDTGSLAAGTYTHGVSTANDTATAQITLSEADTTGTITGTVVNVSSGRGIGGATISAGGTSTTTTADGSYTLTLPAGEYTVEASAEGYNTSSQTVTVTAGETVTATFNLQPNETGTGTPQYQSFTAWVEDGYLQVGKKDKRTALPECPNGEPAPGTDKCVRFTADFDPKTGDYSVAPENFHFPPVQFRTDALQGNISANNTATDTITGHIDIESGTGSFQAPIFSQLSSVRLPGTFSDKCGLTVNVSGTTGRSGNLTGEPGALQPNGTARTTLVDGEFTVPKAQNCGYLQGAVNNDVGLPAGSGENELVMELYIEFYEKPVEEVTSGN